MDDVRRRARIAYEQTRLLNAAPWAGFAVLFGSIAWVTLQTQWVAMGLCAFVLVALRWRGGDAGRAVPIGIVAGAVGLSGPVLYAVLAEPCMGSCSTCWSFCAASGVAMGAIIAKATWGGPGTASFVVSLATVAALSAAIGCAALGIVGLACVLIGVAFALPTWVARTAFVGVH